MKATFAPATCAERIWPFQRSTVSRVNPVPVTCTWNCPPPATAVLGFRAVIVGATGSVTVRFDAADVPGTGADALFTTTTGNVPAVARSSSRNLIVSWVAFATFVSRSEPLKLGGRVARREVGPRHGDQDTVTELLPGDHRVRVQGRDGRLCRGQGRQQRRSQEREHTDRGESSSTRPPRLSRHVVHDRLLHVELTACAHRGATRPGRFWPSPPCVIPRTRPSIGASPASRLLPAPIAPQRGADMVGTWRHPGRRARLRGMPPTAHTARRSCHGRHAAPLRFASGGSPLK